MTARLSPLQRQVLEQLAHIRVAPEDAWMTIDRLRVLTNNTRVGSSLNGLWWRDLVEYDGHTRYRITDKGREALT